jgi:spore maturation protein CgeB
MRFVIFGLSVSSSWGNGHATLWRGLLKALSILGHSAVFYEKDVPYYADNRDGWEPPNRVHLRIYQDWEATRREAAKELADADAAIVTSYCPDGAAVSKVVLDSAAKTRVFYDMDTPVTLEALSSFQAVTYLPENGLCEFDIVLSYTGGRAICELKARLGARRVETLYGWVDPDIHEPAAAKEEFRGTLSYLGTYAPDRQPSLVELLVKPALALPNERFVIGGAQYPQEFPWSSNIYFVRHLPPWLHPSFFCSSRATLNVTRRAMVNYGYCPSGRLFEAAACGTPVLTDIWEGLETFFTPGKEVLPVRTTSDVLNALSLSNGELTAIGDAARLRTLEEHTALRRAQELECILSKSCVKQLETRPMAS